MRDERTVLTQLQRWAEGTENVRTVILTGSRADNRRVPDALSDYDAQIHVRDTVPFLQGDDWLQEFGSIMVRWPLRPRTTESPHWITRLVQFDDGVRVDFQITSRPPEALPPPDLPFTVIIDKDGLADRRPAPAMSHDRIERPTAEEFASRVSAFFWDIVYVAKGLKRDELTCAKYMLDSVIRFQQLHPLLTWHIGLRRAWSVNPGIHGRWFHRLMEPADWREYESTFAGADPDDNWRALFAMIGLFRRLARQTAGALGYDYPEEMDEKVTRYIEAIKAMKSPPPSIRHLHPGKERS